MVVEIRSADPADVDSVQSVARRAWHEAHAPIVGTGPVEEFLAEYYDTESFEERIERPEIMLDVAVDDGEVVGYTLVTPGEEDGTFGLAHIYVAPERWGEGIGRRLLDTGSYIYRKELGET